MHVPDIAQGAQLSHIPRPLPESTPPRSVCIPQRCRLPQFLNWIPLGYIFETQLVKTLVYKFLPQPAFRNDVLACLTEIGSLDISTIYESLSGDIGAAYDGHFEALFSEVATAISVGVGGQPPPMVLPETDMASAHANGSDADQTFIQNLGLFFTCFFRQHLGIAERTATTNPSLLQAAMHLLVKISEVEDQEVTRHASTMGPELRSVSRQLPH